MSLLLTYLLITYCNHIFGRVVVNVKKTKMMISCENAAKPSFLVLFIERVLTVIPSYASFAGVGCIRDAAILEVN